MNFGPFLPPGSSGIASVAIGVAALVLVIVCVVRMLRGKKMVWKLPPTDPGATRCPKCGYDLRTLPVDAACPECGNIRA